MAFPTIPTVAAGRILWSSNLSPAGTHTFPNLSSLTKNAGDLLIAGVIIYDGNSTNAEFSAWGGSFTEFKDQAGTATMGIGLAYKWSTGSETGTFTVTSADTSTNDSVCFIMSIPGAHASSPPEAGTMATGTGAANPANFTPSWGAEDILWIALAGSGETATTGSYTGLASAPTSFTDYSDSGITADVVGGVEGAVAFRQQNVASQDVAAFTGDTSNARDAAIVIAVRPAAAASTVSGSFTADSHIKKIDIAGSFTADSFVKKLDIAGSFTGDAYVKKTLGFDGGRIRQRGTAVVTTATSTQVVANLPSGMTAGDLMVAYFTWDDTVNKSIGATPNGWTLQAPSTELNSNGGRTYTKYWDGSETTVTLTLDTSTALVAIVSAWTNDVPNSILVGSWLQSSGATNAPIVVAQDAAFSYYREIRRLGIVSQLGAPTLNPGSSGTTEIAEGTNGNVSAAIYDNGAFISTGLTNVAGFTTASSGTGAWATSVMFLNSPVMVFTADAHIKATISGSFTADANISRNDIAGTFTADAFVKKNDISGSFTANANIAQTTAGSFTADGHVKATIASTFTANSHIKKNDIGGTLTGDAFIKRNDISGNFTADAYISKTFSGSVTADAYIRQTFASSFTANAHVKATIASSFTADAYIFKVIPGSFAADAQIANVVSGSFTANAHIKNTIAGAFSADAFIKNTISGSVVANAYIRQTFSGSLTADAYIRQTFSGSLTADAYVRSTASGTFTVDAYIRNTTAGTFTADAYVLNVSTGSWTADALIKRLDISGSFTADATIAKTFSGSFTADASIGEQTGTTFPGSFTADAHIKATVGGALSADAYIKRLDNLGSFTADAYVRKAFASTFTADAYVRQTISGSVSADAYILRTFESSATADAFIARITSDNFTADAYVMTTAAGTFTANASIYNPSAVTEVVGNPTSVNPLITAVHNRDLEGASGAKQLVATKPTINVTLSGRTGN